MFFIEREKTIIKFKEKHKWLQIAKPILGRRQIGDIAITYLKLYYTNAEKKKTGIDTKQTHGSRNTVAELNS